MRACLGFVRAARPFRPWQGQPSWGQPAARMSSLSATRKRSQHLAPSCDMRLPADGQQTDKQTSFYPGVSHITRIYMKGPTQCQRRPVSTLRPLWLPYSELPSQSTAGLGSADAATWHAADARTFFFVAVVFLGLGAAAFLALGAAAFLALGAAAFLAAGACTMQGHTSQIPLPHCLCTIFLLPILQVPREQAVIARNSARPDVKTAKR